MIVKAGRPGQSSCRRGPRRSGVLALELPPLRAPPVPGTHAGGHRSWPRLRARRRPRSPRQRSRDTVVMAGTHARVAELVPSPAQRARRGLRAPHRVPTSPRPRPAAPTQTPRTERHYPAQDGTAANMALLALTSLYAGSAGPAPLTALVARAATDLLLTGRFMVRVHAREPAKCSI